VTRKSRSREQGFYAAHRHMADTMQTLGKNDLANEYRQKANELAPPQNAP